MRFGSVWLVALILGLGLASTETFSGFLPAALEPAVGLEAAGWMSALVTLGSILGAVIAPWARGHFDNYKVFLMCVTSLGTVALGALCALVGSPNPVLLFTKGGC